MIAHIFVAFSEKLNFNSQIYGGDIAKFCGLLRIYELYIKIPLCTVRNILAWSG